MGFSGGYKTEFLGNGIWLITVRVNAYTDISTAYNYFHRRAREIVEINGYDDYEVLELNSSSKRGAVTIGNSLYIFEKPTVFGRIKCIKKIMKREENPEIIATGTCFAITKDVVVTNYHIIADHSIYKIKIDDSFYSLELIIKDTINDLALLRIIQNDKPVDLPPMAIGDCLKTEQGETVYTEGFPLQDVLGNEFKISNGIINSLTGLDDDIRMY